jgi:hypothetical protein
LQKVQVELHINFCTLNCKLRQGTKYISKLHLNCTRVELSAS